MVNNIEQFNITRLYSDENGESHFEDTSVPLTSAGTIGSLSKPEKAERIIFRKVPSAYNYDFHTVPARQYIILLDGKIEIETSLGEKRQFQTSDILLVEDTNGKGHKTRNILPAVRKSVFITLKDA